MDKRARGEEPSMRLAIPVLLLSAIMAGCSTAPDSDEPRRIAIAFYDAIRADQGREACAVLSDATIKQLESQEERACPEAITALDYAGGEVTNVHVFITSAKVDFSTGESAFLNREPGGWKLSAIACKAKDGKPRDRPLDCEVEA